MDDYSILNYLLYGGLAILAVFEWPLSNLQSNCVLMIILCNYGRAWFLIETSPNLAEQGFDASAAVFGYLGSLSR